MTRERIAGVVLAAGLSTRMGRNKLLIELGGRTVLRRAVGSAIAAQLDPLLVVLGHDRERAEVELSGLECTPVLNPDYERGMNTSLRTGFRAVPEDAEGAVVLLADMPFVTAGMVCALVEQFRASEAPLVVSTYGGVLAPPMLYGRALFDELRALDGDGCGKQVVNRHRAEALEVAWPESALGDVDLPEDVERVRARLGAP